MQIQQVISILDSVAAGVDPTTGQPLPHDLFRSPDPTAASRCRIARMHGRTPGAINSRLVKLGKVDAGEVNVRERVRQAS